MLIEVRELKYIYNEGMPGETTALDSVTFAVQEPCMLSIIGHTGSGKSTLLQHLNGLIKPASGSIYIEDECVSDGRKNLTDIRRKVGLVFQYPEYQLFEETVAKDVSFGPKNLGLSDDEIEARARQGLSLVGLNYDEVAEASPFELSGGMRRRVAIAGVLAMQPQILMLDEPSAGLDPAAHRDMISMIQRIHHEMGTAILFVSHNMSDVAELSDRVLVMSEGRISMDGTPREVFARADELIAMGLSLPPAGMIARMIKEKASGFESSALGIDELAKDIKSHQQVK